MYYVNVDVYYRKNHYQTINPYAGPSLIGTDLDKWFSFETAYIPEIGEIIMMDKNMDKNFKNFPFVVKEKIRINSTKFAIIVEDPAYELGFEVDYDNLVKKELSNLTVG